MAVKNIGKTSNILAFADDVAIITERKIDHENITKIFIQETKKVGLSINDTKTKYLHLFDLFNVNFSTN